MPRITLILHNIRSTHNVGSIFRTAEGFNVERIIISGYTSYPKIDNDPRLPHIAEKLTNQISKTALGAEKLVPFSTYPTLDAWLEENQQTSKLPLVALELCEQSVNIAHFQPPSAYALLLGEEVAGIDDSVLDHCDAVVEIPMRGQKESFNVSVATGIALYALTSA